MQMKYTPCRILVVDDQADTAETFAYLLETFGHKVSFLTDSADVLQAVAKLNPNIVFLDIGMPGLNGWQVAEALRCRHPYEDLRLIAITAYDAPEDFARSRAAGFDAHVPKPISLALIESIMKQFCRPE